MRRILVSAGLMAAVLTAAFVVIQLGGGFASQPPAAVADASWHTRHHGADRHFRPATPSSVPTQTSSPEQPAPPAASAALSASATSAAQSTSAQPAPAGGYGVPAGVTLKSVQDVTADQAGQVLDALNVSGTITVSAPDVTIKRSKFTGSGQDWAVRTTGKGSVRIEDSTFSGDYQSEAISYHNWSATRIDLSGMSNDGAKLGNNVSLTDSWIHDFKPAAGAHSDGVQLVEDVGNIVIKNNKIDLGSRVGNAAIFLSPDIGAENPSAGPITIDSNTLGGGGYTLYSVNGREGATLQNVSVTNNKFVKDAVYGPVYSSEFVAKTVSGNTYADGSALQMPS
ncbi:right-handed parallel beta-helix repeat-containing protein [Amycolatopsis sp. Poz14]|uniref:right-handed parallel beta-helix repeat-containing protein n=1 Tax=Amycolatopsis sp. Poz14 TaxID=1447705 RepID=UPI001EE89E0C|nr:right-handed parallel beta-helix repeat-containing protein [Amycolatopsis sp. Poz14]MCG3748915.1 right-handed parallel beta-helix repeat-containing protein [Amycolatopsis sp. Poz14]